MNTLRMLGVAGGIFAIALSLCGCDEPKIDVSKSAKPGAAGLSHPKVPTAPPVDKEGKKEGA